MVFRRRNITVFLVALAAILSAAPEPSFAQIDDARAAAEGIRKLPGKRLTLYTDLTDEEIDRLPEVFERAFPEWCRYFGVSENERADWRMTGFLMKDKARFAKAGLLPKELPEFEHGFSIDDHLWLHEQPSDYYRRHLLLHEGTHGFMNTVLGHCGPVWYMEGIAEYLATHLWLNGRLTLGYMPRHREELPQWGRIRLIQDAVKEGRMPSLKSIVELKPTSPRPTEFYAWCWAAAALLDRHPRYRDRFRQLIDDVRRPDFNDRFYRLFQPDWRDLCEQWQIMTAEMEYGYDAARTEVDFTPGKPLTNAGANVAVAADRGWQNSGLQLDAGVAYELKASGRYQVADRPTIWWCEPGGVSIRYYRGRPLGVLLAAVRPENKEDSPIFVDTKIGTVPSESSSAFLKLIVVGLGTTLTPRETGTLFFKINDSPGELDDNAGELNVEVRRKPD